MRITDIKTIKVPPSWVWVKIETDEGVIGWGEPYLECHGDTVIAEVERMKPFLMGKDPTAVERRWQDMYDSGVAYVGGPVKMSAISGIDMALWDIKGKAAHLPIYRLLGGPTREGILMYHACGEGEPRFVEPGEPYRAAFAGKERVRSRADERREAIERGARGLVEWGYRCLKIHAGIPGDFTRQHVIGDIAECFAATREAVGSDVEVAIDIHNPQPQMAVKLCRMIERYNPLFIEEPVRIERIEDLAVVAAGTTIPVAAGERWMGKWDFRRALDAGARILQPDMAHAGGITELRKIAAVAECYGAYMAPHNPLSIVSLAASFQLGMGINNYLVQEHNEVNDYRKGGRTLLGYGYLKQPFELGGDGLVRLTEAPGLGIEIDEAAVAEMIKAKVWSVARG